MRGSIKITTILIAAAFAAPVVTAQWYAFGEFEPDNEHDDPTFMWERAPLPGEKRVYFNGYTNVYGLGNPNVGALHSANEAPSLEYHQAILGVWTDCNGDDYVGHFESIMYEYPKALLADETVCPASEGPAETWNGANNYNGWVTEFIPIAGTTRDASDDDFDLRVIRDPGAMVWGDAGRHDQGAGAAGGGTCAGSPQPRGTYQSTGGFIEWVGCVPGLMARWNEVVLGRRVAGQQYDGLDAINPVFAQLAFHQDEHGDYHARGHPLWDHPTLGSERSERAAFSLRDCDAEPAFHSGDFFNSTPVGSSVPASQQNRTVPTLNPRLTGASDPTVPGQYNLTSEQTTGDCNTTNNREGFYGILEDDFSGVSTNRKTEAAWNFQFTDWTRGRVTSANVTVLGITLLPTTPVDHPTSPGPGGAHNYHGLTAVQNGAGVAFFNATSVWESDSFLVRYGPRRAGFDTYNGTPTDPGAEYFVFYAYVSSVVSARSDLQLPSGRGEYGMTLEQCGGATIGVVNNWECDKDLWYRNAPTVDNPQGTPYQEPYPFARPGQAYQFRDVDCHDGRNALGIPLGFTAYGNEPCTPYPFPATP